MYQAKGNATPTAVRLSSSTVLATPGHFVLIALGLFPSTRPILPWHPIVLKWELVAVPVAA